MFTLARTKKQKLRCHITAVDKIVIARKDEIIDPALYKRIAAIPNPGREQQIELGTGKVWKHLMLLQEKPKYAFLRNLPPQIEEALKATRVNNLMVREMEWLSTFPYFYHNTLAVTLLVSYMCFLKSAAPPDPQVTIAGLLHNCGMSRVPLFIIEKHSFLDDDERQYIYQHPLFSALLLCYYTGSFDKQSVLLAQEHHERDQKNGYPFGLAPRFEESRWIRLCDRFIALISSRPYRPSIDLENAMEILEAETRARIHSDDDLDLLKTLLSQSRQSYSLKKSRDFV